MRKIVAASLILLGLVIFGKKGGEAVKKRALTHGPILAFGDSLTYGYGTEDPTRESYPAVLERLVGLRVINAGVNGETSAEGLRRIDRVLKRVKPELTILCLGGNDILRRLDREALRKHLRETIGKIRRSGSELLLLSVPEFGLISLRPVPLYRELAEELDVPLLEGVLTEILGRRELLSDPVHPNAQGYRLLAERIHGKLLDLGNLEK